MGYMRVIEGSTTWTCPKTGSYKIICVAGGEGGGDWATTKSGESTSFGHYVTASGNWGGICYAPSNYSINLPGRNGYTFLEYGGMNNLNPASNDNVSYNSIGYGAGGSGKRPGGCGKLKMAIVTIKEGETIECTIGAGGTGSAQSGKSGVIVIQYQGNDGFDTVTDDGFKDVTITMYAYGELISTAIVNVGDELTLPRIDNIKPDDIEHYGWTKTCGSDSRNYGVGSVIYPTDNMELYAVFKYDTGGISTTYDSGPGTVGIDGIMTVTGYKVVTEGDTKSYGDMVLRTDGETPYVTVNGNYISGTANTHPDTNKQKCINVNVKAGDVVAYRQSAPADEQNTSYVINVSRPMPTKSISTRSDV